MENLDEYKLNLQIRDSFFDANDKILFSSIMQLFQDIAGIHSEEMGIGYKSMLDRNLYWILVRMKIDILSQPRPHQFVTVYTYAPPKSRFEFERDFYIKDTDGKILVKATSKWVVIDTKTRKLSSTNDIPYPNLPLKTRAYSEKFTKTETIDYSTISPSFSHTIAFHEIDHNLHLNNVNYANYILDALKGKTLSHVQINFISECVIGNKIEIYSKENDNEILLAGVSSGELKFTASVF